MDAIGTFGLIQEAEPPLVYLVFTWLRERYRNHPAAEGVIGRIVAVTNSYPSVTKMVKEGQDDAISKWFEDEHTYRELGATEFVALIVEKLES